MKPNKCDFCTLLIMLYFCTENERNLFSIENRPVGFYTECLLVFQKKDTVFRKFQTSHVIGELNVHASVSKLENWGEGGGGWVWLRPGSDAKLFTAELNSNLGFPNQIVRFSTSIIHPFLGSPFLCINFEREIFSLKSHDGLEMAAVLYQLCLLPYVWKGELWKLLF